MEGTLGSACFLADGRDAYLLGLTRQYAGVAALGAGQFTWCGNVTLRGEEPLNTLISDAVQCLVRTCGLVGMNGIDFIVGPEGPVLLEVNPRPPASFELFERQLGVNAFFPHVDGCQGRLPARLPRPSSGLAWGKGILYACRELSVGDTAGWEAQGIVDIPRLDEIIPAGGPICTVLASEVDPFTCWQQVLKKAISLQSKLMYIGR